MVEQNKMAGPLVVLKYYQLSDFMIADFSWSTIKPARLSGFMASQVKKWLVLWPGWIYCQLGQKLAAFMVEQEKLANCPVFFIASWVQNWLVLWPVF